MALPSDQADTCTTTIRMCYAAAGPKRRALGHIAIYSVDLLYMFLVFMSHYIHYCTRQLHALNYFMMQQPSS